TRSKRDWSSDVCSSDLDLELRGPDRLAEVLAPLGVPDLDDLRTGVLRLCHGDLTGPRAGILPVGVLHAQQGGGVLPEDAGDGGRSEERRVGKAGGCGEG